MMKIITGLLTLSEGILCKKEVLGKSFKAQIANIEVDIFFPRYPNIEEMHNKDVYPSDQTTDDLVKCVEVFLGHFHNVYY